MSNPKGLLVLIDDLLQLDGISSTEFGDLLATLVELESWHARDIALFGRFLRTKSVKFRAENMHTLHG